MSATLPVTILRGVQAILAIIVMGTAAAGEPSCLLWESSTP